MIVMDHSFGVFKAVINSSMQNLPHENMHPGSTIIIAENDWKMIYNKDSVEGYKRGILFVNNLTFEMAPSTVSEANKDDGHVTPDHSVAWIDTGAIAKVKEESVMLSLDSYQHEEGFFYWYRMSGERVRNGDFADSCEDGHNYKQMAGKRAREHEPCGCQGGPHFFEDCMLVLHPLSDIDTDVLFRCIKEKLQGRVKAKKFVELSQSHKRWSFYWYYAVNFFHLRGEEAQELPSCFVAGVRKMFPEPKGNYTGFKSAEERNK
jgi:hypothetical protein